MSIEGELEAELKDAMRMGDGPRRDVIRQIRSEVGVAKTAPGFAGEVGDDLYRSVIEGYVKKMQKSLAEYRGLGPQGEAMAGKLQYEVDYLSRWVPSKLDEEETRRIVDRAIADLGAAGDPKAAGRVIGQIMKQHRDVVDGALVNRLVRESLGG